MSNFQHTDIPIKYPLAKETINKALVALNTMMDVRISVAQTKLQKKLLKNNIKKLN